MRVWEGLCSWLVVLGIHDGVDGVDGGGGIGVGHGLLVNDISISISPYRPRDGDGGQGKGGKGGKGERVVCWLVNIIITINHHQSPIINYQLSIINPKSTSKCPPKNQNQNQNTTS